MGDRAALKQSGSGWRLGNVQKSVSPQPTTPSTAAATTATAQQQAADSHAHDSGLNGLLKKLTAKKKPPSRADAARLVSAFAEAQAQAEPPATSPSPRPAGGALVSRAGATTTSSVSATTAAGLPVPVQWARVFHQRMLHTLKPLGADAHAALVDAVHACSDTATAAAAAVQPSRALESLAEYLVSHALDPDNALIGVGIAEAAPLLQLHDGLPTFAFGGVRLSETTVLPALVRVTEAMAAWAAMGDRDLCAAVRAYASDGMPPAMRLLRRGTLVAVRLPAERRTASPSHPRTVYGRVSGGCVRLDGRSVCVTTDPYELAAPREIPVEDVALFPAKLVPQLTMGVAAMQRLCASPCQDVLDVVLVDAKALLVAQVA
jgi:hypothetical protein